MSRRAPGTTICPADFGLLLLLPLVAAACVGGQAPSEPGTVVTPTPTAASVPVTGPSSCTETDLRASIDVNDGIGWTGAMGSRMATIRLRNAGSAACVIADLDPLELVDGEGRLLIAGGHPGSSSLVLRPGEVVATTVRTADLCAAPEPVAPVRVRFLLGAGSGTVTVEPLSASDVGGVPPCNGDPNAPAGEIEMHAWAP
jgi:hypothetical protein